MNKLAKTKKTNELDLINENIKHLSSMVTQAVEHQVKIAPQLQEIATKTLAILSKDEEQANLEPKDLIKLAEMASKGSLQPVEQLTKLVQAVSSLYEKSVLEERMQKVEQLINRIDYEARQHGDDSIEAVFEEKENNTVQSLDELL